MNSSIACRYPRFDSGERRLSRTADLLWSRSGRPSFVFGRFSFEDFRLACLLIPAASTADGQEPMPARRRVGRLYSQVAVVMRLPDAGRLISHKMVSGQCDTRMLLAALCLFQIGYEMAFHEKAGRKSSRIIIHPDL